MLPKQATQIDDDENLFPRIRNSTRMTLIGQMFAEMEKRTKELFPNDFE